MNAAGLAVQTEKAAMRLSAAKILERTARSITVQLRMQETATVFQKQWKIRDLSVSMI